jgi:hypothetical protein
MEEGLNMIPIKKGKIWFGKQALDVKAMAIPIFICIFNIRRLISFVNQLIRL